MSSIRWRVSGSVASRPDRSDDAPSTQPRPHSPPRRAPPRPKRTVVCPGFGFDRFAGRTVLLVPNSTRPRSAAPPGDPRVVCPSFGFDRCFRPWFCCCVIFQVGDVYAQSHLCSSAETPVRTMPSYAFQEGNTSFSVPLVRAMLLHAGQLNAPACCPQRRQAVLVKL